MGQASARPVPPQVPSTQDPPKPPPSISLPGDERHATVYELKREWDRASLSQLTAADALEQHVSSLSRRMFSAPVGISDGIAAATRALSSQRADLLARCARRALRLEKVFEELKSVEEAFQDTARLCTLSGKAE